MKRTRIAFRSGKLQLEGMLEIPETAGTFPAVVVCHPHSLYGGSMDAKVVYTVCRSLAQASIVALRFNFRGVGSSEGEFSHGIEEQEDVAAAISFITTVKEVDVNRIGLSGYSFGAAVGMPVGVEDERVKALAAISPPFSLSDFKFLINCSKPKFLVMGDADDFTAVSEFLEFCSNLVEPKECETIRGADHFWGGYESELASRVADFFSKELK